MMGVDGGRDHSANGHSSGEKNRGSVSSSPRNSGGCAHSEILSSAILHMPSGRSPSSNLDLLRAIAVLLVLAQHLLQHLHFDHLGWIQFRSLGLFGVFLFFVHTSLVLMYSMERSHLTGWQLGKNFAVRRFFRIYPLSILAVATALLLHLNSDVNGIAGLSYWPLWGKREVLANFLLIQNLAQTKSIINVLWSLPFELQMYVLLPFLFLYLRGKRLFWPMIGLWLLSVVGGLIQPHFALLAKLSILLCIPNFLPGVIAYVLPHEPRIKSFLWPVYIVCLIVIFTLYPTQGTGWVLCLVLGLGIPIFAEITTPWVRLISNRIATYSYGIYLSHQFSIWVAFALLAQRSLWLKVPVLAALLILLPVALYHAIEKPMIQFGINIAHRWSRTRAERVEAAAVA
jgi:peptidoglycan/LPS O-acetylase OafA/YrhL